MDEVKKPRKEVIPCRFRVTVHNGRKHSAVDCDESGLKCLKCGWNPDVEKARKEKLYAERGLTYAG